MNLHQLAGHLFSFFFSLKLSKSSVLLINRMRVAAIYVVALVFFVSAAVNLPFVLDNGAYLTASFLVSYLCLVIISLILLWTTRRLDLARFFLGVCVFLLIGEQIIDGGGVFGLGVLYLMFGFPVVYLLFGIRLTFVFMAVYYGGLLFRLNAADFLPTSIFNTPDITYRMMIILGIAVVLQATICLCFDIIIRNLVRIAYYDRITGLPNRFKFLSQLKERMLLRKSARNPVSVIALKTVNLNKINSMLGPVLADELMHAIGSRLASYRNGTRAIGRWSSSVFLLMADLHEQRHLEQYTTELIEHLSGPFLVGARIVSVFFNVAVSRCPEDAEEAGELINCAISLLERNRSQHGDVAFYTRDIQCCQARLFGLLDDLNNARFDDEFYLVYQPKIRVTDMVCIGAEVLLRWNNPKRGDVPPGEFIPVAEQCGMIHSISRWVIKNSFAEIAAMAVTDPSLVQGRIFAINLSVTDLYDRDFVGYVEKMQQRYDIPATLIEFEITEGVMLDDDPRVSENLTKLLEKKFRIAIDDFGTGYSSLGYLQRLRVHNLKIDRSFVQSLFIDPRDEDSALIDAIISMSKSLKLEITAEGVETANQFRYLGERGCDSVQGFLFSHGIRQDAFVSYCRNKSPSTAI